MENISNTIKLNYKIKNFLLEHSEIRYIAQNFEGTILGFYTKPILLEQSRIWYVDSNKYTVIHNPTGEESLIIDMLNSIYKNSLIDVKKENFYINDGYMLCKL